VTPRLIPTLDPVATDAVVVVRPSDGAVLQGAPGDALRAWYCGGKPVVAAAVGALVAAGVLEFESTLADVLDLDGWMGGITLGDCLSHRAGLHVLDPRTARIVPESQRDEWARGAAGPTSFTVGVDVTYAAFGGWWFLGQAVERVTSQPLEHWCAAHVVAPYGVDADDLWVRIPRESFARLRPRIVPNVDVAEGWPIPLLAEACPQVAGEWNPGYGVYATTAAMATWCAGLVGDLDGRGRVMSPEVARAMLSPVATGFDPLLGRDVSFGLGVMTCVADHHFGPLPRGSAFASSGEGGSCWVVADPDADLVVAAHFGELVDASTAYEARRADVVTACFERWAGADG
jgi:CubicO group peptidase (beta-lactamase class C family)